MTRPPIPHRYLAALLAMLSLTAPAAAQPVQQPRAAAAVPCDAFQRQPLGAWTVLRPVTIAPEGVSVELPAGRTFSTDETFEGIDIGTVLDRYCGNRQR